MAIKNKILSNQYNQQFNEEMKYWRGKLLDGQGKATFEYPPNCGSTFRFRIRKTPIFALIIASVGCFQGMQVKENADSVGENTTRSVVLSIFFIIVADAIFSVIFSKLKL